MASIFARRPVVVATAIVGLLLASIMVRAEPMSADEHSTLDRAFDDAYEAMLKKQIPGDWPTLVDARLWQTPFHNTFDRQLIADAYRDHIQTLLNLPTDLNPETPVKGLVVQMNDVSPQYDFTLRLFAPCPFMYDDRVERVCHELGQLIVRRKGEAEILRVFTRQFQVGFDENRKPKNFTTGYLRHRYDEHGNEIETITRDFNFDGHEDLVIFNDVADIWQGRRIIFMGEEAPIPSLLVHLFDPKEKRFVYSEGMSAFLSGSSYSVSVDPKNKRFQTYQSGESCSTAHWSQTMVWQVTNNQPIPVTRQTSDLGLCAHVNEQQNNEGDFYERDNERDYCYVAIKERFVDGAWQEVEKDYTPCTLVESEGPVDSCEIK